MCSEQIVIYACGCRVSLGISYCAKGRGDRAVNHTIVQRFTDNSGSCGNCAEHVRPKGLFRSEDHFLTIDSEIRVASTLLGLKLNFVVS